MKGERKLNPSTEVKDSGIVGEERLLDLFQLCRENCARLKFPTDLYESSHYIHAHRDRSRAAQNRCRHHGTVFSEGEGAVSSVPAATDWLEGHNL